MKLTTPATASLPYTPEAPSLRISTRSMADRGMALTLTELPSLPAKAARRRPLTSTRVRAEPRPRREMDDRPPVLVPAPAAFTVEPADEKAAIDCSSSSVLAMSALLINWTGRAVSASTRLTDEPVISTRWIGPAASCAMAAWVAKPRPTATLPENIRRNERDKTVSIIFTTPLELFLAQRVNAATVAGKACGPA